MRKKVISPAARREQAQNLVEKGVCSQRAVCRMLRLARSTCRYRGKPLSESKQALHQRLVELSQKHARYGYRRITALMRQEGWTVGRRQVQRWRRNEGLRVPPTRRKLVRRVRSTGLPTQAAYRGHVWTWDFIADATVRGGGLRILTILDEYTRECHVLRADRALKSRDVLEWLQRAIEEHGAPAYLRSDNGPEFIAAVVQRWLKENGVRTLYIEPGSPWQNGFVESFHGRFRDECLNREQLHTLTEARVVIGDYREEYNRLRPHSRLGYLSPANYARQFCPSPAPVGLRPSSTANGQNRENKQPLTNA
jgi:transposase InsO family protein